MPVSGLEFSAFAQGGAFFVVVAMIERLKGEKKRGGSANHIHDSMDQLTRR